MIAPLGYQYFGCPKCGMVYTLPACKDEPGPSCYCVAHVYSWHREHGIRKGKGWVQTERVAVQRLPKK